MLWELGVQLGLTVSTFTVPWVHALWDEVGWGSGQQVWDFPELKYDTMVAFYNQNNYACS